MRSDFLANEYLSGVIEYSFKTSEFLYVAEC